MPDGWTELSCYQNGSCQQPTGVAGPGPACGDGVASGAEQCDDGNLLDDDGCSPTCIGGGGTGTGGSGGSGTGGSSGAESGGSGGAGAGGVGGAEPIVVTDLAEACELPEEYCPGDYDWCVNDVPSCDSGTCVGDGSGGRCTKACSSDGDCTGGAVAMRCLLSCVEEYVLTGVCWDETVYALLIDSWC